MISQKKFNTKQFNEVILMEENMIEIINPELFVLIMICQKMLIKMGRVKLNLS